MQETKAPCSYKRSRKNNLETIALIYIEMGYISCRQKILVRGLSPPEFAETYNRR